MRSVLLVLSFFLLIIGLAPLVQAQTIDDFFNFGNKPVNYDPPYSVTRGQKRPDSIDECLKRKEFSYNEQHNIWVKGLVRCKVNPKGVLSKADINGISEKPEDEQACSGKRERQIIVHGTPDEDAARYWAEHCSYLGALGGAQPAGLNPSRTGSGSPSVYGQTPSPRTSSGSGLSLGSGAGTSSSSGTSGSLPRQSDLEIYDFLISNNRATGSETVAERNRLIDQYRNTSGQVGTSGFESVYTGTGVKVPDASLVAKGISKERSLIKLIVFYTNATLPYVSVISVFAFVSAGLYYILSFTNEELNAKAKSMMIYVVIGIIIIFSAYTIVNTLLRFAEFT